MPKTPVTAAGRAWLAHLTRVAAVSMFVAACDRGADDGSLPSAGEGGAQAGSSASGGSSGGSIGGAGGGGAPSSGGMGGARAGSQATSGGGGAEAGAGSEPSIDDVDLTLGGLNQDLPAPSVDCLERPACVAASGEYNGMPFDIACMDAKYVHTWDSSRYTFGCNADVLDSQLTVELIVMRDFVDPAMAFDADTPTPNAFIRWRFAGGLADYTGRLFEMYGLDESHDQTVRVSGVSEDIEASPGPGLPPRYHLHVAAAFALSLMPKKIGRAHV